MIRNQWYVVLESHEVSNKPMSFRRMGENLVFWRNREGKVTCFRDKCSHRGVALSMGEVVGEYLQCPFHGLEFDSFGRCICIPANGRSAPVDARFNLSLYETFEDHGFIWLFWGEGSKGDSRPEFFDNLQGLSFSTKQDLWNTHYSRVIENQLDVAHLPFIHRRSIGRGNKTLVDGPLLVWKGENKFHLHVFNKPDDGSRPLKPDQLTEKSPDSQHLEFIFPNLWQNYIMPKMRVTAAFVPVDDDHTIMYLRFYQGFVIIPLLRDLVNKVFMRFNLRIAHEDRRVVNTHFPKKSNLKVGENLFQADHPIIEFRKLRERLQEIDTNQGTTNQ
jgi:phenylpropionate dioxygenase-like ring-hydroxylating dioxygenase large terminal subunit